MGGDTNQCDNRPLEEIQSELEATFCPPLDPALIAALVSELDPHPGSDALESLRLSLSDLAVEASVARALDDRTTLPSDLDELSVDEESALSGSQTSASLLREAGNFTPGTSEQSSDTGAFETPLGFLRIVFPNLSIPTLKQAIELTYDPEIAITEATGLDMGLLVESLLSEEFLREEKERASEEVALKEIDTSPDNHWTIVKSKTKRKSRSVIHDPSSSSLPPPKPRKPKAVTVPLVDLLQRQKVPARRPSADFDVAPDPWSHLASLASRLRRLVPNMAERKWLALFHNPAYPTPSHAVRAELQRLALLNREVPTPETLAFFLEVLGANEIDESELSKKHDAGLCLQACRNNAEDALDLFRLLEDMDLANAAVIHSVPYGSSTPNLGISQPTPAILTSWSVPQSSISSTPPSPPLDIQGTGACGRPQNEWQTIAPRRPAPVTEQHPLAAHIPAYRIAELQNGRKRKAPPSFKRNTEITPAPPIPSGLTELEKCRWWIKELRRQRNEAVRAAGRHWRAGTVQDRGGDVAFYYAEEGRKLEEKSREWALKAARLQLRQNQKDPNTIDLHGFTLQEALHVAREAVNAWYSSSTSGYAPNHSFTIITGLGKHSVNQHSVLGPAVFRALQQDGWKVIKRPATIVVTGVSRG